jgi:hypothetical protein
VTAQQGVNVTHMSPRQPVCYRFETVLRFLHVPELRYGGSP